LAHDAEEGDPVAEVINRDAFQRACIDLALSEHVICGRVGDHGVLFLVEAHRSAARAETALDRLAERAATLARRRFGLRLHLGVSVKTSAGSMGVRYEQALAAVRAEQLVAEARLRSLESRLHPHFLFNTLNSISALIMIDPPRADRIVGRLSALLRASLDTSSRSLIPLGDELAMVEDYVDIERARFGDRLRCRVEAPAELRDANVPPLSVQSLVENAVKHGIAPQRSGGDVLVSASAENGRLTIEVSDTGEGFDLAAIRAGHGLDSLVRRLDALFSAEARVNVSRRADRCVVQMVLPRS
jgi:LytS/YehU family sensor histidine kinase